MTAQNGSDLPRFSYHRAAGLADAHEQLRRDDARPYAGGTDLVVALRLRLHWASGVGHLVDIKDVREAHGIARSGNSLRIGALATATEVAASAPVRRYARALSLAASLTSAPWIRARGTVGGNVVTPHPAGDMTTALLALDSIAELSDSHRKRLRVPLLDVLSDVAKPPGPVLLALYVPMTARSWYERVARRRGFSRATIAVAVVDGMPRGRVAVAGLTNRPTLREAVPASPMIGFVDALAERAMHNASSKA